MTWNAGVVRVESSAEPPYEQIKSQVDEAVTTGRLRPGDKLPPVRQLAGELGLAPNTVARAYRELEHRGTVVTRGRAGTFVSVDDAVREARTITAGFVARLRSLGLADADILEHVTRALRT